MKVLFVAGFGPIVEDVQTSARLYRETLGLPLKADGAPNYLHTGAIGGVRHFALWHLSDAAESCFGTRKWPEKVPRPNSWLEFDVEDIDAATEELKAKGYPTLVARRIEPWGQIVTRFLSPEGILVGLTVTPEMRGTGTDSPG